jgi:hypothetical protein
MKKARKLKLNKETLRILESTTLSRAAGAFSEQSQCPPPTYTCQCSDSACLATCDSCHWYCFFTITG